MVGIYVLLKLEFQTITILCGILTFMITVSILRSMVNILVCGEMKRYFDIVYWSEHIEVMRLLYLIYIFEGLKLISFIPAIILVCYICYILLNCLENVVLSTYGKKYIKACISAL